MDNCTSSEWNPLFIFMLFVTIGLWFGSFSSWLHGKLVYWHRGRFARQNARARKKAEKILDEPRL
jgi:hypothetical protein